MILGLLTKVGLSSLGVLGVWGIGAFTFLADGIGSRVGDEEQSIIGGDDALGLLTKVGFSNSLELSVRIGKALEFGVVWCKNKGAKLGGTSAFVGAVSFSLGIVDLDNTGRGAGFGGAI
jgi:hypothetical protein